MTDNDKRRLSIFEKYASYLRSLINAGILHETLAPHHLVQLQMLLQDFEHVQSQLNTLEVMITEITQTYYSLAYECLDSITGIAGRSAQIILSEAGNDMSRFSTADL